MEVVGLVALLVIMAWNAGYWMGRSGRTEAKTVYVERHHVERPVQAPQKYHIVESNGVLYEVCGPIARAIGPSYPVIQGYEIVRYGDGRATAVPSDSGLLWKCACCGATMGSLNKWCIECGHKRSEVV
jgi:hypothetical protein